MKKIVLLAAAIAFLAAPAAARSTTDPVPMPKSRPGDGGSAMVDNNASTPTRKWTKLQSLNGDVIYFSTSTIYHFPDDDPLAGSATVMIYRDIGPMDGRNLHTILFDCRGRFSMWGKPEISAPTSPDTLIGVLEETVCAQPE